MSTELSLPGMWHGLFVGLALELGSRWPGVRKAAHMSDPSAAVLWALL